MVPWTILLPRHTDPIGLCWTNWHCRLFINRNNYFSCANYLLCYWETCHPNINIEQTAHNIYTELWVISGTAGTFKNGNLRNNYYSHIFRVWPEEVQLLSNVRICLYMVNRVKGDKGRYIYIFPPFAAQLKQCIHILQKDCTSLSPQG